MGNLATGTSPPLISEKQNVQHSLRNVRIATFLVTSTSNARSPNRPNRDHWRTLGLRARWVQILQDDHPHPQAQAQEEEHLQAFPSCGEQVWKVGVKEARARPVSLYQYLYVKKGTRRSKCMPRGILASSPPWSYKIQQLRGSKGRAVPSFQWYQGSQQMLTNHYKSKQLITNVNYC